MIILPGGQAQVVDTKDQGVWTVPRCNARLGGRDCQTAEDR